MGLKPSAHCIACIWWMAVRMKSLATSTRLQQQMMGLATTSLASLAAWIRWRAISILRHCTQTTEPVNINPASDVRMYPLATLTIQRPFLMKMRVITGALDAPTSRRVILTPTRHHQISQRASTQLPILIAKETPLAAVDVSRFSSLILRTKPWSAANNCR
nr:hypothetical protein [uncultured bacterium]